MYNGVINIYKEKGFTSHDVVAKMRGILQQKKMGHTGTLDPDAVGVLPVCLGNATRLADMLTDRDKEYEAVMRLGVATDTQDMSGTVLEERPVQVSAAEVEAVICSFVGGYEQVPPMYSALKVNGKRLYELAREGREVERKARSVSLYSIEILSMQLPEVCIRVACSKGTYIRTLCHDIGEKLGCGAAMSSLKRTQSGCFTLDTAITLSALEQLRDKKNVEKVLIPVDAMFDDLAQVHVPDIFIKAVQNGNLFSLHQIKERCMFGPGEEVRVYDSMGRFYGIYAFDGEAGVFKPRKMFL
ncbi:MAG: tRNA pseudouridine(55) synthase TruB [Lachnospiraceae bacterium]|nr:tRNA pseudouridine(55) synthase TruB [Lachnospiraceae bacterium]